MTCFFASAANIFFWAFLPNNSFLVLVVNKVNNWFIPELLKSSLELYIDLRLKELFVLILQSNGLGFNSLTLHQFRSKSKELIFAISIYTVI